MCDGKPWRGYRQVRDGSYTHSRRSDMAGLRGCLAGAKSKQGCPPEPLSHPDPFGAQPTRPAHPHQADGVGSP